MRKAGRRRRRGTFHTSFEDKPSPTSATRWVRVDIPRYYNPGTSRCAPAGGAGHAPRGSCDTSAPFPSRSTRIPSISLSIAPRASSTVCRCPRRLRRAAATAQDRGAEAETLEEAGDGAEEKRLATLNQQLNTIRNDKAAKAREKAAVSAARAKDLAKEQTWRSAQQKETRKKRYRERARRRSARR